MQQQEYVGFVSLCHRSFDHLTMIILIFTRSNVFYVYTVGGTSSGSRERQVAHPISMFFIAQNG